MNGIHIQTWYNRRTKEVKTTPESTVRYQKMLNNFKAMQGIDKYTG